MLTAYALQFLCMHSDQHCTVSTYMFLMAIITSPFSTKTYIFFGKKEEDSSLKEITYTRPRS
jgi:hypothetical protein